MHRGCKFQIYNHDSNLASFLFNMNTHTQTQQKTAVCGKDLVESWKNPVFLELYRNSVELAVLTSPLPPVRLQRVAFAASQFAIEKQNSAVTEMGSSSGR